MCIHNASAIAYTIVSLNNYCKNSLLRLGNTIQNIDISILNSRYLESIPILRSNISIDTIATPPL